MKPYFARLLVTIVVLLISNLYAESRFIFLNDEELGALVPEDAAGRVSATSPPVSQRPVHHYYSDAIHRSNRKQKTLSPFSPSAATTSSTNSIDTLPRFSTVTMEPTTVGAEGVTTLETSAEAVKQQPAPVLTSEAISLTGATPEGNAEAIDQSVSALTSKTPASTGGATTETIEQPAPVESSTSSGIVARMKNKFDRHEVDNAEGTDTYADDIYIY